MKKLQCGNVVNMLNWMMNGEVVLIFLANLLIHGLCNVQFKYSYRATTACCRFLSTATVTGRNGIYMKDQIQCLMRVVPKHCCISSQ